ncbi:MAG TPA: tetratricopeptide repeat protein [Burkholderiaceae bacterium]|nr:tetratricopeptide repeat protein [Burkholderiaceae bacterium]
MPERDEVVETQLLPRAVKQSVQRLERSAPTVGTAGAALPSALRIDTARRLIQAGRASGDPRTLGYAEAHLALVPDSGAIGVEALVLRATIEQSRHRFDAARALLDRALEQSPMHVQARLTRATIAHVRGDLTAARADCDALQNPAPGVAVICRAINDSLSGSNAQALKDLEGVNDPTLRSWALSLAGEIHEQQGALGAAVRAYNASLAIGVDLYTSLSLADALIAQQRWPQAEALLSPLPPTDAVLLRRWIVARAQQRDAVSLESQLAARFSDAQARGELLHAREAALFALERGDSVQALVLARQNWNDQREPADLRILARAGRAANDSSALVEVRDWLAQTGLRDVRIERVLAK